MLVKRIGNHNLPVPAKQTKGAAAFDLQFCGKHLTHGDDWYVGNPYAIAPGETITLPTGFAWNIPAGFVGMVCSRSGLASKHGVVVLNAPGIIDPDYTGEIKVILHNTSKGTVMIYHGDRVAQMLITPAIGGCCVTEVAELPKTERGDGGLGSTGK